MRFKEGEDEDKWLDDDRAASLTPGALSQLPADSAAAASAFFSEKKS